MTAQQLYAPYGAVRYSHNALPTSYSFTGQRADPSGLDYFHARYYDPALGQFTSADTVQGPNRYGYVQGNPESGVDPTGHCFDRAAEGCDQGNGGGDEYTPRSTFSSGGELVEEWDRNWSGDPGEPSVTPPPPDTILGDPTVEDPGITDVAQASEPALNDPATTVAENNGSPSFRGKRGERGGKERHDA